VLRNKMCGIWWVKLNLYFQNFDSSFWKTCTEIIRSAHMMNNRAHQPDTDEIITGSTIVVISPKTELKLVNFVKQVLP
jgi:hypothetical protein